MSDEAGDDQDLDTLDGLLRDEHAATTKRAQLRLAKAAVDQALVEANKAEVDAHWKVMEFLKARRIVLGVEAE